MIPVLLILEGVYSYRNRTEIDFQPMVAAGIFGVFGKVGSGKSAIIEAITYSLYGKTDRYGLKEFKKNMMNLKSKKLYIEFQFKSGKDNLLYKTITTAKRKNNSEEVENYNWTAYRQRDGEWQPLPLKKKEMSEIIGIDYDNFKKSIIIQQGKFLEFLQLDPAKRHEMLMSLFNLGNFDLSSRVKILNEKNDRLISTLEGKLSGLNDIDENSLAFQREKLELLVQSGDILKKDIDDLTLLEKNYDGQKKVFDALSNAKRRRDELTIKQNYYEDKRRQLEECRKYSSLFKDKFQFLDEQNVKIHNKNQEIDKLQKEKFKLETAGDELKTRYENAKKQLDAKNDYKEQEKELRRGLEIKATEKKISIMKEEIERAEIVLHNEREKLVNKEKEIEVLNQQAAVLHQDLENAGDPKTAQEAMKWFDKRILIENQLKKLSSELSEIEEESAAIIKSFFDKIICVDRVSDKTGSFEAFKTFISRMDNEYTLIKEERTKLETKISQYEAKRSLNILAENLAEGKPCPLCGSESHPHISVFENIDEELSSLKNEKMQLDDELGNIEKDMHTSREISGKLGEKDNRRNKLTSEMNSLHSDLKQHLVEFRFAPYQPDDKETAERALDKIICLSDEIKKFTPFVNSLNDEKKALENECKKSLEKYNNEKSQYKILCAKYSDSLSDFTFHKPDEISSLSVKELDERLSEISAVIKGIEPEYFEADKLLTFWKDESAGVTARLNSAIQTLNELQQDCVLRESEINQLIHTETSFQNFEEIRSIIGKSDEMEKDKKEIDRYFEDILIAGKQVEELESQLEKTGYDADAHNKLSAELNNKKNELDKNRQEIGQIEGGIVKIESDLVLKTELEKEMRVYRIKEANLDIMRNLFAGKSFVNYVSTAYLVELCNTANERFEKLTQNQLRLELTTNNEFIIRDFLNDGQRRDFKSLSGGQAFQAALCLALALSEKIQQFMGEKQKLFFMDEGFGTLDNETLDTVFQTLKHLHKENRIVGIISHVESLQEQIDMYLSVTNKRSEGSVIKESWKY